MNYVAPLSEITFLLRAIAPLDPLFTLEAYAHSDSATALAVIEEAAKLAEHVIAPLNPMADSVGARLIEGCVLAPPGFREAYAQLAGDGWTSLAVPVEQGGQGLPQLINTIVAELFAGASVAFQMALLTGSPAAKVIAAHGDALQQAKWLPKLASGEAAATIVITEPQAGSDVGLIRTKAEPRPDGSYAISGTKIFISQGDHDLSPQILHVVLARTANQAAGSRGLSLFLVPKLNDDGSANGVRAMRIEHKMGLSGSPTCEMMFDQAQGMIVGREGEGLRNLFAMMNAMRLDVAAQGIGVASAALRKALVYVHERKQGHIGKDGPVPIVEHPDVRRMLIQMRAWTDGLRALLYTAAWWEDQALAAADLEGRKTAAAFVGFLLPILKAGGAEAAFTIASQSLQLHGGHGYVRDHGVEQLLRDSRVFAIYEGANTIQANDLVMRKLGGDGGAIFRHFHNLVQSEIKTSPTSLGDIAHALERALQDLSQASDYLLAHMGSENAFAAAPLYLQLAIEVATGWMWLKMARAEENESRLLHARWFAQHVLPETHILLARIEKGADVIRDAKPELFQAW
ncbi:MAG: acyl-CoA dehydrogenase [Alphaproteobacteria bacterium]|nr:acyl-CoA dehydrogenase [Alphaproteobacteria bacterium]